MVKEIIKTEITKENNKMGYSTPRVDLFDNETFLRSIVMKLGRRFTLRSPEKPKEKETGMYVPKLTILFDGDVSLVVKS